MRTLHALVGETNEALHAALKTKLAELGFGILECSGAAEMLWTVSHERPSLILLSDMKIGAPAVLALASAIRVVDGNVPIILITDQGSERFAVAGLRSGISDYLSRAEALRELDQSIQRCLPDGPWRQREVEKTRFIGESRGMREVRETVRLAASGASTVLITGETGTGKELVAEMIHNNSERSGKPFVSINCAAIPDSLLESELFGYEKGAFTGAHTNRDGKLASADHGSIFLDEIGDMSAYAQAKILRLIESKEIQRLGSKGSRVIDVRAIAATNQDLEVLINEGLFRKDLYYRLNVVRIDLPSLRERREDIPALFDHYIDKFNRELKSSIQGLTEEAMASLVAYEWPGNVRELKNLVEAILPRIRTRRIQLDDLPRVFRERMANTDSGPEMNRILAALFSTNWNKSKAAQQLQWSRVTLYRKISKYNLQPPSGAK